MTTDALQQRMADYLDLMAELNAGKSGDYSLRMRDRFVVTPTGVRYRELEPGMFPVLSMGGEQIGGDLEPSSEIQTHLSLYDAVDAGAVVHTHSPWVTTLAALGESPDFVHYSAAVAGTEIPVVSYETYGTGQLAERVVETLSGRDSRACVMANHGLVCYGESLDEAFDIAEGVEFTARIHCQSRMVGEPNELTPDQVEDVANKFDDYGQD